MQEAAALRTQAEQIANDAKALLDQERAAAIAGCKATMQKFGLTYADLGAKVVGKQKKAKTIGVPKYKSPDGKTWSGKGRQPSWYQAAKKAGTEASLRV